MRPIDQKWINTVVKAFKKKPETFKNLLQGRGAMMGECCDCALFHHGAILILLCFFAIRRCE